MLVYGEDRTMCILVGSRCVLLSRTPQCRKKVVRLAPRDVRLSYSVHCFYNLDVQDFECVPLEQCIRADTYLKRIQPGSKLSQVNLN